MLMMCILPRAAASSRPLCRPHHSDATPSCTATAWNKFAVRAAFWYQGAWPLVVCSLGGCRGPKVGMDCMEIGMDCMEVGMDCLSGPSENMCAPR
eukprot:COSAG01_NODE_4990_length_4562_cov_9.170961_8_plen_95_part_00